MTTNTTLNLNGRIEKTDVSTLLRSVEHDKLSGELNFNRQGERVDLYFLFGQLYHAKWGEVSGLDAVSEVLTWRSGNYSFTEGIIPAQASISEDIEQILAGAESKPAHPISLPQTQVKAVSSHTVADSSDFLSELAPFDLASLSNVAPFSLEQVTPVPFGRPNATSQLNGDHQRSQTGPLDRVAPPPPANGLYRTRLFCLPMGEQMATSLMATGPQLEEELLHLAEIGFTGYILGGPEADGFATLGICLLGGRFIHAFYHNGNILVEGEKAYRTALDQNANTSRFYWFYEIIGEAMRSAISLLTPPTRYSHLEIRVLRFKELLRLLNEESHTGCVRISIGSGAGNNGKPSQLAGERAYMPIFRGEIMGLWTDSQPKLTHDGQLLQHYLNEAQAYLDLHTTAPVSEPGLPLEALIGSRAEPPAQPDDTFAQPQMPRPPQPRAEPSAPQFDDDERQFEMIGSIGAMESTWTQVQKKSKGDQKTMLLTLAGFVNELLSLVEKINGKRGVQDLTNRAMRQELAPFRTVLQVLDLSHGRVNVMKLLKEYDLFQNDATASSEDFAREASRGLRTLIRSCFQYYVSLIRRETVRFECQEMYEVFLQDVVRKM